MPKHKAGRSIVFVYMLIEIKSFQLFLNFNRDKYIHFLLSTKYIDNIFNKRGSFVG